MMWKNCTLLRRVPSGTDSLENTVYTWEEGLQTKARFTPWTDEQIALDSRGVTLNQQRFALPDPFETVKAFKGEKAEIDGEEYSITEVIDLSPRYSVIQGKVYKR